MNNESLCPRCGALLEANTTANLCPDCARTRQPTWWGAGWWRCLIAAAASVWVSYQFFQLQLLAATCWSLVLCACPWVLTVGLIIITWRARHQQPIQGTGIIDLGCKDFTNGSAVGLGFLGLACLELLDTTGRNENPMADYFKGLGYLSVALLWWITIRPSRIAITENGVQTGGVLRPWTTFEAYDWVDWKPDRLRLWPVLKSASLRRLGYRHSPLSFRVPLELKEQVEALLAVHLRKPEGTKPALPSQQSERGTDLTLMKDKPTAKPPRRTPYLRRWMRIVAGTFLGLVLLFLVATFQWPLEIKNRLANGPTIKVAKVMFGKVHEFEPGHFQWGSLVDWFSRLTRQSGHTLFGYQWIRIQRDSLSVWMIHEGPPLGKAHDLSASICDLEGHEYQSVNYLESMVPAWQGVPDMTFYGWCFTAFPRQARNLMIRMYQTEPFSYAHPFDKQKTKIIAEFVVPNPVKAKPKFLDLAPAPWPQTQRAGDCDFTLTEIQPILLANPLPEATIDFDTALTFEVTRKGKPATGWQISNLEATDASDNLVRLDPLGILQGENRNSIGIACDTWCLRHDAVWQLRITFAHQTSGETRDEAVLKGIAAPEPNQFVAPNTNLVGKGYRLQLLGIAGTNAQVPGMTSFLKKPYLALNLTRDRGVEVALVKGSDAQGRNIFHNPSQALMRLHDGTNQIPLNLTHNAITVDLTFATVQDQRHQVAFVVRIPWGTFPSVVDRN